MHQLAPAAPADTLPIWPQRRGAAELPAPVWPAFQLARVVNGEAVDGIALDRLPDSCKNGYLVRTRTPLDEQTDEPILMFISPSPEGDTSGLAGVIREAYAVYSGVKSWSLAPLGVSVFGIRSKDAYAAAESGLVPVIWVGRDQLRPMVRIDDLFWEMGAKIKQQLARSPQGASHDG